MIIIPILNNDDEIQTHGIVMIVLVIHNLDGAHSNDHNHQVLIRMLMCVPANTKHMYNICTMLDQRQGCWADDVQMLYKCFVFAGVSK